MAPPAPGLLDAAASSRDTPQPGGAGRGAADAAAHPPEEQQEVPVSSSATVDGISASAMEPMCSNGSDSVSGLAPVRVNPVARCGYWMVARNVARGSTYTGACMPHWGHAQHLACLLQTSAVWPAISLDIVWVLIC